MNFIQFMGLEGFGVQIAVVAAVVAVTEILLGRIKSVPDYIVNYLPLLVAAVGTVILGLILKEEFVFSEELFYESVLSYSAGSVVYVTVKKILRGEKPNDAVLTLVIGIAESICRENARTELKKIAQIVKDCADPESSSVKSEIISLLKSVAKDGVTKAEITDIAQAILLSAQKIGKAK